MSDPLGPTVLIAYDGGPAATRALASFVASGLGESRDVHVVTVGDDGEKAMETAMHAAENLRSSGIKATPHGIVSALPDSDALVEFGSQAWRGLGRDGCLCAFPHQGDVFRIFDPRPGSRQPDPDLSPTLAIA
jgi:hypothetical protein